MNAPGPGGTNRRRATAAQHPGSATPQTQISQNKVPGDGNFFGTGTAVEGARERWSCAESVSFGEVVHRSARAQSCPRAAAHALGGRPEPSAAAPLPCYRSPADEPVSAGSFCSIKE